MKILQVHQLKAADAYTIIQEPITPIDLMERAAQQCVHWILTWGIAKKPVSIFCGKGGNGGDGLAIARLLANKGINASVYILEFGKKGTPEFQANLERLHALPLPLHFIQSEAHFPQLFQNTIVIDALYGFGLDRPLDGLRAALVHYINESDAPVISIDLPSGLFADKSSVGNTVINATHTLTFECYKLGLLVAENGPFIGTVHVLPIQLHTQFLEKTQTDFEFVDDTIIRKIFKPRPAFAHKGSFGHALIAGGSFGKIGALVLATQACLRSGSGLVTTYMPRCGYEIMQSTAPEAMALVDEQINYLNEVPPQMEWFDSIGIGPGMGTEKETSDFLLSMISTCKKP
ncbi:MAG TPA: NAD(P)H-hydrate epimerase, partial [Chitinophagaceae bacterium]|nr:NAD(P)H-hydrate epimerase [Chitinophagaceae bacterium]